MPQSKAVGSGEEAVRVFEARVRELEQRYEYAKIYWGRSWSEIPTLIEEILAAE